LKSFTAKELIKSITENIKESRKELLLHQFKYFGSYNKNVEMQFWNHDNHPFYLYRDLMIQQKQDYIHQNPVKAGFVDEAQNWRLSSANTESPIKVLSF
jgi:putative transposase